MVLLQKQILIKSQRGGGGWRGAESTTFSPSSQAPLIKPSRNRGKIQDINTMKNTVISPNFLVQKFCGKAQFPYSFGRIAQNYAETVHFHKISTTGNQVKLQYFSQRQEIMKYQENPKISWDTILFPVSPTEINFWHQRSKNLEKQISKFFCFV